MNATDQLYQMLAAIPAGKVVTYGQLAQLSGKPRGARWVGQTLNKLPRDTELPWHRVINAQGKISMPLDSPSGAKQQRRLAAEGVLLHNGRVPLKEFQWHP